MKIEKCVLCKPLLPPHLWCFLNETLLKIVKFVFTIKKITDLEPEEGQFFNNLGQII